MDWLANDDYAASTESGPRFNDWQDKLLVDLSTGIEPKPTNWSFIWGLRKICRSNECLHRVMNGLGSEAPSIATPGFKAKKPAVYKKYLQDAYGMAAGTPSAEDGATGLSRFSPEIYLTFIYLVTLYHIRFGNDARKVTQDTANFQYCLREFDRRLVPHILPSRSEDWPESRYSGVLNRLAFEMIKLDIAARTFDLQGDLLKRPWSDPRYLGTYTEFFERSQYAAYELWGPGVYPLEETQDDLETGRAQSLHAWATYKRYEITVLRHDIESGLACDLEIDRLYCAFLEYVTHMQLIHFAMRETSEGANVRLIAWVRCAVAHFNAAILDFHCTAYPDRDPLPSNLARNALDGIIVIALKLHESDDVAALMRIAWPLLVAGLETRAPLHQEWILDRYASLAELGTNFARASACLRYVIERQRNGEPRLDFRVLVKNKILEPFVLL
ncbi:hypothetical protein AAFC00_006201 [Neodothiora populina]|uniref:Uncharacterized protein n=1 Tax=Neodothiora populina TaxID=2781224 RepID=A0ABR3P4C0_9PEZI